MANRSLFSSRAPRATTVNEAGGRAYEQSAATALAQLAVTGCFSGTFYVTADAQLDTALTLTRAVSPEEIARTAIYARANGKMKDMPALLCAVLVERDPALLDRVFDRVIDDVRMLRNFVQIVRSGAAGRRSLGSAARRLVRRRLESFSDDKLFRSSVGAQPSLADVVRLAHPKPNTPEREALYGWLTGKVVPREALPKLVASWEAWKAGETDHIPDVPFMMLTGSGRMTPEIWRDVARRAPWQTTRMNLNTFLRQGVFEDEAMVETVAARIRNAESIRKARALPYQLLAAYMNARQSLPGKIREALHDALEIATSNVPSFTGQVAVCPDVSGSMHASVTGHRRGATSKVRCVDVAGLFAASVLRNNGSALVIPFSDRIVNVRCEPRDTVMTNAIKLASAPPGGTRCSEPLAWLNARKEPVDLVILVSDNESWGEGWPGSRTATMREWTRLRRRCPQARLVCIDIQPYTTAQAPDRPDVLNVGGFSDEVFRVVAAFSQGGLTERHWREVIDSIEI